MTIWRLDVERVRVVGASARGLRTGELRALVEAAVRDALETAPLPKGRAVTASVRVNVPSLAGGAEIARAVAGGLSQAVGGRAHG
jgi:hypothetical protein